VVCRSNAACRIGAAAIADHHGMKVGFHATVPWVEEFAILSEIVANLLALAAKPKTPAFIEEEIVI
jgi:hypothetical protein